MKKLKLRHVFFVSPLIAVVISLCVGRYPISVEEVAQSFVQMFTGKDMGLSTQVYHLVCNVRMPRALVGALVGAVLSASGCAFQGVFRNPLVSPSLLGVSSGASFGAALSILIFSSAIYTPYFSFIFGIVAVTCSFFVARMSRNVTTVMLILGGTIVSSLFSSMLSLMKYIADPYDQLASITFWSMGSLASISMSELLFPVIGMFAGAIILLLSSWSINILSMGDDEAKSMGLNVSMIKYMIICGATLATASAVSIAGTIGWIGLIVPHMARFFVGSDNRKLVPYSMLLGSTFLVLVDVICRTITSAEIPIGIMLSFIGAPFFVYLLRRYKGGDWR